MRASFRKRMRRRNGKVGATAASPRRSAPASPLSSARRRLLAEGYEALLTRKRNTSSARARIFDGAAEAKPIALAKSPPTPAAQAGERRLLSPMRSPNRGASRLAHAAERARRRQWVTAAIPCAIGRGRRSPPCYARRLSRRKGRCRPSRSALSAPCSHF